MSIAALADNRLQRTEAKQSSVPADTPPTKAGIPAGMLNTLTAWIPTETIAGYVAIQAAIGTIGVKAGTRLCDADFHDRWVLFWLMLAFSVVLVPLYTRIKANSATTDFKWPVIEMGIAGVAFALWALALQDSPFDDWCGVKEWYSVAALVIGGGLLSAITAALKESPPWSEASNNNAPPSPKVH